MVEINALLDRTTGTGTRNINYANRIIIISAFFRVQYSFKKWIKYSYVLYDAEWFRAVYPDWRFIDESHVILLR